MPYFHIMKCLTILLLCCFDLQATAQEAIPMEITPQGHTLIKAKINGVEGVFLFDTGAGLNLLTKNFADKVKGLRKEDGSYVAFRSTGEKIDAELYAVEKVQIGQYMITNSTLSVMDVNLGNIDGLLSLTAFRHQPFTIDMEHKQLIIETAKSVAARRKAGLSIPLQLENARERALDVFAHFRLNNALTLQFLLDSGAGKNIFSISSKYLERSGLENADTAKMEKRYRQSEFNADVKTATFFTQVPHLATKAQPAVEVRNFKVQYVDGLIYDGIISINWMGGQLTFDLDKAELLVAGKAVQ